MGASQSANSGSASGNAEIKTSYYELLGIDRQATEDEVKKAYRRKALELHPDRNFGNEEAATKLFAEVQAAHEVLSDPQERAWYDSHESAILRGDDGGSGETPTYENVRVTTADDLARMIRKFNSKVEFTDSPSGFFGFLRETFEQLAKEEDAAASWEKVESLEYPTFGHRDDEYNDVVKQFYTAWSNFSTVKTFSWLDQYRLSEAPDRWYRRRMEQENARLRQDGKREFNDAVRSLVAFIKKRDPRYEPSTQTEAERQKTLRDAAAAQAARARAANAAKAEGAVPEWTMAREPDELEESEEDEVEEQILECVACDKVFKSENQWVAHEKSKKHQKALRALQARMRKENAKLDLDSDLMDDGHAVTTAEIDPGSSEDLALNPDNETVSDPTLEGEGASNSDVHESVLEEASETTAVEYERPASGSTKVAEKSESESNEASGSEDADYASISSIQARMQSASLHTPLESASDDAGSRPKSKMGKAAQKRAKKAAAAAAADGPAESGHICNVCNNSFPSKNKLFQHCRDEDHAALKPASTKKGKGGKGKR